MDSIAANSVYRFRGFALDLGRGALLASNGAEIPLRRKSFELLQLLVQNAGRLLDRDTINQVIWPDVTVTDDGVTQCVGDIRRALGDDAQHILKTVPRRGYLMAVEITTGQDPVTAPKSGTIPLPAKPSIAVLPFTNMSRDTEQEYFADGVAEDIITQLSHNRALFVIARNSTFTYKGHAVDVKQIGRDLAVRYLLEGSVRRAGGRVRITAQLLEAGTGNHIWAERYDRAIADVFAVQDEISDAVVTAIGPAIADAEMQRAMRRAPETLDAWDLYQRGIWHLRKENAAANDEARQLFERAIERDPMFAAAHAGLSLACFWAGSQYQTAELGEAIRLSSGHAREAVELDPGNADAQATLAGALMTQGDLDNAIAIARQALATNANCAAAHRLLGAMLIWTGRMADGREATNAFVRLSPRDPSIGRAHGMIAISHYFDRDYEQCVEVARRQLTAHPGYALTYRWLAAALGQLGRTGEAGAALAAISPREFGVYVHDRVPWMRSEDQEHMIDGLRKAGWQE